MRDAGDGWPRLTRSYGWEEGRFICGVEIHGGTRPAQIIQILQVPPDTGIAHGDALDSGRRSILARIFHRSRATNEYGIALVCPKIQVSNLDQRAGNAEAKLYRRN
ncbi:MAG TPA: hypothetical protein PK129_04990 [Cellvibrionaceae bacterium]|nr:hypothetical protein [Cellvibrionaceae bacterium]